MSPTKVTSSANTASSTNECFMKKPPVCPSSSVIRKNPRRETLERPDTQRRLCTDTGRICRSENGECTRTQLHRQPRRKTPADWRKEIYYRYWTNHAIRPAHFAIRSERYKLIFYYAKNLDMTDTENFDFTPAWDFYDLEEDPHENHNLYNDPKYAPIIRQMKKIY